MRAKLTASYTSRCSPFAVGRNSARFVTYRLGFCPSGFCPDPKKAVNSNRLTVAQGSG